MWSAVYMRGFAMGVMLLILVAGCAAPRGFAPVRWADFPGGYTIDDAVDTETGKILGPERLMDRLAEARVIYVGEMHTSPEDHRVQLEVLKTLRDRGLSVTVAVEMLPRSVQGVLDRYVRGEIQEEAFLEEVKWRDNWGYPFKLYRPIFQYARENGIRIVALNAPIDVVKKVARGGLASLSEQDRAQLAKTFHLDDDHHRRVVREEYVGHMKEAIRDFDTFFEAQLSWEETMAETLAGLVESGEPRDHVVVLVGKGHIRGRVGVPDLTFRRVPRAYVTIAPVPLDYPGSVVDPDLARVSWITAGTESQKRRKLGVAVRAVQNGPGLEVLSVMDSSAAARAGIRTGDMLLEMDGKPLRDAEDIGVVLQRGKDRYRLEIRRGNESLSIDVRMDTSRRGREGGNGG